MDLDNDPGPEVFETSDVESIEDLVAPIEQNHFNQSNTLEISAEGFDAARARERFEAHAILDLEPNYLGSVSGKVLGALGISVVHWAETRDQKLKRISRELDELQSQDEQERCDVDLFVSSLRAIMDSGGKEGYYYQKLKQAFVEIDRKKNELEKLALGEDTDLNPKDSSERRSTEAMKKQYSGNQAKLMADYNVLESRLTKMEGFVGIHMMDPKQNLRLLLNDLSRKVNILNNAEYTLEPVFKTVSRLNADLENLLSNRRKVDLLFGDQGQKREKMVSSTPFEAKIDRLFNKLPEIETTNRLLPALVTRLRSLHEIHSNLGATVGVTDDIDRTLQTLQQDLRDWTATLEEVEKSLEEKEARFDVNVAVVEKKLQLMEQRLAKTQAS